MKKNESGQYEATKFIRYTNDEIVGTGRPKIWLGKILSKSLLITVRAHKLN